MPAEYRVQVQVLFPLKDSSFLHAKRAAQPSEPGQLLSSLGCELSCSFFSAPLVQQEYAKFNL